MRDNMVCMVGSVLDIEQTNSICGRKLNAYIAHISIKRISKTEDIVTVLFNTKPNFSVGSRVILTGYIQSLKNSETGKVLVYVHADYIVAAKEYAEEQNDIRIVGRISKKRIHRITPKGRHITDVYVITENVLTKEPCFIPAICWGKIADEVAKRQEEGEVQILGRFQSRKYTKGKETKTAYEFSISKIEKNKYINRHLRRPAGKPSYIFF